MKGRDFCGVNVTSTYGLSTRNQVGTFGNDNDDHSPWWKTIIRALLTGYGSLPPWGGVFWRRFGFEGREGELVVSRWWWWWQRWWWWQQWWQLCREDRGFGIQQKNPVLVEISNEDNQVCDFFLSLPPPLPPTHNSSPHTTAPIIFSSRIHLSLPPHVCDSKHFSAGHCFRSFYWMIFFLVVFEIYMTSFTRIISKYLWNYAHLVVNVSTI